MTPDDVLRVYDGRYAAAYDETYITNPEMLPATMYQSALLKHHIGDRKRWLDLACGTGFYLSLFPEVRQRVGLDLSPSMLKKATRRASGATFFQGSFLSENNEWINEWEFVSCMWWSYCLVSGIHDIESLVSNMALWVTPDGTVFLPLCNPRNFRPDYFRFPATDAKRPGVRLTGVMWSWTEAHGGVHRHMISPFPETMRELFSEYFREVTIVSAPRDIVRPGYWSTDFLVARKKRRKIGRRAKGASQAARATPSAVRRFR